MFRLVVAIFGSTMGAVLPASLLADDGWLILRDPEFSFRVAFPRGWRPSDRRLPNVRMFFHTPEGAPTASCNVIVRSTPSLTGLPLNKLDDELRSNFSDNDWVSVLGSKGMQLQILDSRTVKLNNRSAKRATIEASYGTPTVYLRYTAVLLLRPGAIWTLTCGGGGTNWAQARQSYSHWENTFNRIVNSIAFELDATPP